MIQDEIRYLMRKQVLEAMTPPLTDYRLIGMGRVLVLVGWIAAAVVWLK